MGKKGYILSGAALLAALTLLAGCGKNNDTEDKNTDKPDTDPAQEIVLVQPEAADVPVDFETAQKAWPDAYAYMKIPNATGCAIREGGFLADGQTGLDLVYVRALTDGAERQYWVSTDSGLLYRQTTTVDGTVVYEAEQTLLEPLAGEDAALADAFRLPDGTDPFTSAS